jgi:hypothetical protein
MWCSGSYSWPLLERSRFGHGFKSPLEDMCVFLILARCGAVRGNVNGLCGGGNEKDRTKNENDRHENGGRTGMTEQEWWQNTGMTDYSCSLNK